MPSKDLRRYKIWYATLLRLYPKPFREHYSEQMAQTFQDLCRERSDAGRGLLGFVMWVFLETSGGIIMENTTHMTQMSRTTLRVALGALAALMVPLVASRVVDGWNWPARAFVVVYLLFFAIGMAYALIARKMSSQSYKAGVGLALAAGFALGWSNMVQVADSGHPENLLYYVVLVVGFIGACVSRLHARGLAWTMFAMAATLALIALLLPSGAPPDMALRMAIGHGVYVVLFAAAGLLFRHASRAESRPASSTDN